MKRRFGAVVTLAASFAVLASQAPLAAQQVAKKHSRYTLKLLDTLGGPGSQINSGSGALNREGTVAGGADTTQWDGICGCYVNHAVRWRNGVTTDLGTLPGGDTGSTQRIFLSLKAQVGMRFYTVDFELKRMCGKLRDIENPLRAMRTIQ